MSTSPTANTSLGVLVGTALLAADQFLGIPYGTARRFEAAIERTAPFAEQPRLARDFGPACLQFLTHNQTYGSEHECFVVNVWRPRGAAAGLPVLVYVPGGENAFGEGSPYNASALAANQNCVARGGARAPRGRER